MPTLTTAQARAAGIIPGKRKRSNQKPPASIHVWSADPQSVAICALPLSSPNSRMHWTVKNAWARVFREAGRLAGIHAGICKPGRVVLTRYSSAEMDDDNLPASMKAIRDGIADAAGAKSDSRKDGWDWVYQQAKCPPKKGHVIVSIK